MTTQAVAGTATSTAAGERSLAPDLARGVMLLLIALAHAPAFVTDWTLGFAPLNAVAEFLKYLVADNLARAMFMFLFGYALGQLTYRREQLGDDWPAIRKLHRRRGFWLLVIGFVHTAFLPLDIVAVYGVTLLIFASMIRARDKVLLWTAGLTLVPAILLSGWQTVMAQSNAAVTSLPMESNPLAQAATNVAWFPVETPFASIVVLPAMLLGLWAARRRVLDEPARHVSLLRRVAVAFLAIAVVGRLPLTLIGTGVWPDVRGAGLWAAAFGHTLAGYAGGIGIAALVGLVAVRFGRRRGAFATALAALGQRSLTFYLFQSVVFVALFYPFTLDLAGSTGIAGAYGIALGTFVVSVLLAEWMRRVGHRGPAEILLRRLTNR